MTLRLVEWQIAMNRYLSTNVQNTVLLRWEKRPQPNRFSNLATSNPPSPKLYLSIMHSFVKLSSTIYLIKYLYPALLTEFDDIIEDLLGVCVAALLLPSVSLVRFLHSFYPFIFASVFIQIEPFILTLGGYQQVIRTRRTKTKVKIVTHLITPVFIVDLLVDDMTSKKCVAIAQKIVLCCWTWNCNKRQI